MYNLVRAAKCSYAEAKKMPIPRAMFYLAIEEELIIKREHHFKEMERKARRGRRH